MATEADSPPVAEEQPSPVEVEAAKPEENHVEENKPAEGESQSAEKIEDAVEEKKEENGSVPPKVRLHQHPPTKTTPSFLPSSLKLETYLRMCKIPYENVYAESNLTSSKVKLPFIEYQGDRVQDANFCIKYLNKKFEADPDSFLTPEQKAMCHCVQVMVEENTYWSLAYYRWVDNYDETKSFYDCMAPVYKTMKAKMDQNKCIKCMQAHGIGKHTKEEIYSIAEDDIRALSTSLGEKEFFMDSEPCTLDCTVFGLLACFVYGSENSPQNKLIREDCKNLADFCDRMKLNYWLDWGDICNEEQADKFKPKSKLSMSARRKKTKDKDGSKSDEKKAEEGAENGEEKVEEKEGEGEEKKEEAVEQAAESAETPAENAESPAEEGAKAEGEGEAKAVEPAAETAPATEGEKSAEPEQ